MCVNDYLVNFIITLVIIANVVLINEKVSFD